MGRGRKSAQALANPVPLAEIYERARPPAELTDDQVEVWTTVTQSMPHDWFSDQNLPLLTQYCRHIVEAKRIAAMIKKLVDKTVEDEARLRVDEYENLLKMQERESRTIASLATKMRFAQTSTVNPRGIAKAKSGKPWEAAAAA